MDEVNRSKAEGKPGQRCGATDYAERQRSKRSSCQKRGKEGQRGIACVNTSRDELRFASDRTDARRGVQVSERKGGAAEIQREAVYGKRITGTKGVSVSVSVLVSGPRDMSQ